jgi:hypothetical protein
MHFTVEQYALRCDLVSSLLADRNDSPTGAAKEVCATAHFDAKNSTIDTNQVLLQVRLAQLCCVASAFAPQSSARLLF